MIPSPTPRGGTRRLADDKGRVVPLNLRATWCAPCREKRPSPDRLEAGLGGDGFVVVPIATGRDPPQQIDRVLAETGLRNLPVLLDPRRVLARAMGVPGLPVTVLIDGNANEVPRLPGKADWASDPARKVRGQLTAPATDD